MTTEPVTLEELEAIAEGICDGRGYVSVTVEHNKVAIDVGDVRIGVGEYTFNSERQDLQATAKAILLSGAIEILLNLKA